MSDLFDVLAASVLRPGSEVQPLVQPFVTPSAPPAGLIVPAVESPPPAAPPRSDEIALPGDVAATPSGVTISEPRAQLTAPIVPRVEAGEPGRHDASAASSTASEARPVQHDSGIPDEPLPTVSHRGHGHEVVRPQTPAPIGEAPSAGEAPRVPATGSLPPLLPVPSPPPAFAPPPALAPPAEETRERAHESTSDVLRASTSERRLEPGAVPKPDLTSIAVPPPPVFQRQAGASDAGSGPADLAASPTRQGTHDPIPAPSPRPFHAADEGRPSDLDAAVSGPPHHPQAPSLASRRHLEGARGAAPPSTPRVIPRHGGPAASAPSDRRETPGVERLAGETRPPHATSGPADVGAYETSPRPPEPRASSHTTSPPPMLVQPVPATFSRMPSSAPTAAPTPATRRAPASVSAEPSSTSESTSERRAAGPPAPDADSVPFAAPATMLPPASGSWAPPAAPGSPAIDDTPEPPAIQVSIGRIEVRLPPQKPAAPRPVPPPAVRGLSLADYLRQRSGGRHGGRR